MPKFSEKEKEIIRLKLKKEAEKLFSLHGIKKVTVDELVKMADISKGAFYSFYESKEHLYIEINYEIQSKIFKDIEDKVKKIDIKSPKKLTEYVIKLTLDSFMKNHILKDFNYETLEYLKRKLPEKFFLEHMHDDSIMIKKLENYGVKFAYSNDIIVKVLHTVFAYSADIKNDKEYKNISNILIEAIINKIVLN